MVFRLFGGWQSAAQIVPLTLAFGLAACGGGESGPSGPNDNLEPVARFTSVSDAVVGQEVALDASGSSDRDGHIVAYQWLFGDGGNGTGPHIRHIYTRAGQYEVTLTVTDDAGASARTSRPIVVAASSTAKGDAGQGAQLYSLHCTSCHAVGDPFETHDLSRLAAAIETTMPPGNAVACDADCSADIAAFTATW